MYVLYMIYMKECTYIYYMMKIFYYNFLKIYHQNFFSFILYSSIFVENRGRELFHNMLINYFKPPSLNDTQEVERGNIFFIFFHFFLHFYYYLRFFVFTSFWLVHKEDRDLLHILRNYLA
jgi:hypothetical protein